MEKTDVTKDRRPLAEYFEKVWSQALVAVSTVEEEATKVVQRVADAAGWSQDEVRRHAREFAERLAEQRRDLESNVEEGVKRALARVRLPRRDELAEITARLDRIDQRLDALREDR
jgi:polyhydroxyalkanoate synthesis regulator phasin